MQSGRGPIASSVKVVCSRTEMSIDAKSQRRLKLTSATHVLALHSSPSVFLLIATQLVTIDIMLPPSHPMRSGAEDKLAALRRLDKSRVWNSLDDQLYCFICKTIISGSQIEVVGGTNGLRALRLKCSTPGCFSTPADWILPVKSNTTREIRLVRPPASGGKEPMRKTALLEKAPSNGFQRDGSLSKIAQNPWL
jgi:hypothetical protein